MKIRIKFAKRGSMKFIGHLDMMRYFQKAIRRANIDIAYTEGFSPHQKMSFAQPLGVGMESEGEYFDIEVHSTGSSREMLTALNSTMVEGIEILSYRLLSDHAENAMSIVGAASYQITVQEKDNTTDECYFEQFPSFFKQNAILAVKQTKKGEREIDLKSFKPFLYNVSLKEKHLYLLLSAGSSENIKPELVLKAYQKYLHKEDSEISFLIKRLDLYAADPDHAGRWISLEQLGDDIE